MKPVTNVNPATDETKQQRKNTTEEADKKPGSSGSYSDSYFKDVGENSAQSRRPVSESHPSMGADFELGKKISGIGHRAQEIASTAYDSAREYGGQAVEQTGTFIRRYPTQMLFAGFGAGVLLGLIIRRR